MTVHLFYNGGVNAATAERLLDLNRQFYQTFALQFAATRRRLQPGVHAILPRLDPDAPVLDLGCGNGEVAQQLFKQGYRGLYVGIDQSLALLEVARERTPGRLNARFYQANLAALGWMESLPSLEFGVVLCFAFLHHVPDDSRRRTLLENVRACLAASGSFIHSEWQFLNSARLRARVQAWELLGLSPEEVDSGDYLLDWRDGGLGFRYGHSFTPEELALLAEESGFTIVETFLSDGEENRLGLYQVWKLV